MINVSIKELPAKRVAVMEHHGDPMRLSHTLDKLITWAKAGPINLKQEKPLALPTMIQRKFQQKNFALIERLTCHKILN